MKRQSDGRQKYELLSSSSLKQKEERNTERLQLETHNNANYVHLVSPWTDFLYYP